MVAYVRICQARCVVVILIVLVFSPVSDARAIKIGVGVGVENALKLQAAVIAALRGEEEAEVPLATAEPDEPLSEPNIICKQASDSVNASVGVSAGAVAATRAGLALLLTEPAPENKASSSALELYPHSDVLAKTCAALCTEKDWRHAVLLHEGSARVAAHLTTSPELLSLRARQIPPPHDDHGLRNLLLVLKKWGATNFIVWCNATCSVRVLDAAQRVGLLADRHSYIMSSLDLHTMSLANYSYGGANITSLRLFNPESKKVSEAMTAWSEEYRKLTEDAEVNEEEIAQIVANPPTSLLLSYDAVKLVAAAIKHLNLTPQASGDCLSGKASFHADTLLNYLRSERWEGLSGPLSWEAGGGRLEVRLYATELERGGRLHTVASWTPRAGLAWRPRPPAPPLPKNIMTNRTFAVLIAENNPYIMKQQSTDRLSGNNRYEGFCIELIDRLAKFWKFNYTFIVQPDGLYGTLNKTTNQWDGMMRRLMDDPNIDFAITDLTITAEREQAVDFTTPFMNLGISILFRKPQPPEPALLAFLLPFSNGVWLCLGFAYVGTSLVLYVIGRLCPEEWQNPYPCVDDPPALENQFTIGNALWFNLGAVLQQGSEIAPVAYGTRAVASVWWMFALVITSSYTANLATLLATKSSTELISSVRDLADNPYGITYGAKAGGSTYTFFELSTSELYKKMFAEMKKQEMPKNNTVGIQKVKEDNYAFLAESTTIEYTTERDCEVIRVGDLLDSKGYGIAMKKGSEYRQALNLALLNLQEAGVLREMKHRWWKEMHGGGACQPKDEHESEELSMRNFMGLFLVLVVGCALGVMVSCCDLVWTAWRHPRDPMRPFTNNFWSELLFVFHFEQSVKPVRGPLQPEPSVRDSPAVSFRSELSGESNLNSDEKMEDEEMREESRRRLRSGSQRSGRSERSGRSRRPSARRRSSMHAASVRLARHATRASDTPGRATPR
ncbi:unnamed protein product, partial [Brenthis ino]